MRSFLGVLVSILLILECLFLGFLREERTLEEKNLEVYKRAAFNGEKLPGYVKYLETVKIQVIGVLGKEGSVSDVFNLVQLLQERFKSLKVTFVDKPVYGVKKDRYRVSMEFRGNLIEAFETAKFLTDSYPIFVLESVEMVKGENPRIVIKGYFAL